ncbi:hypothetical protein [Paenibacillus pinisoli]|uniref:hypothetical protein n=1 Tax=Paenibacillus pinisoli TaxID=1276110 RepID=UPI0014037C50|nr:hypothetical protein [Paenibacillus pinisoli]
MDDEPAKRKDGGAGLLSGTAIFGFWIGLQLTKGVLIYLAIHSDNPILSDD